MNSIIRNNSNAGRPNSALVVHADNETDVTTRVVDGPGKLFELLGDPDAVSDAFFDALARLLLEINDEDDSRPRSEEDTD